MNFVDGLVECEFIDHLTTKLGLTDQEVPQTNAWSRVGNTIGALALRLGLMTEHQVDQVLEIQDNEGGYFGELAARKGLLTAQQVQTLLDVQTLHDQLQLGEQLVIAEKLDTPTLLRELSDFLSQREQ